ncbi:MAG: NigD-like N-terminal domain-containing protein [Tannerella sp.]|jgi:hypothetical protein|nr:NigD-like N-terminal domain-containing protein [Tannerella sp.]
MKRNLKYLGIGLMSVFLLSSCLDDNDDKTYVSYGVIRNVSSADNYQILTDKGNTLMVTKSHTSQSVENDKRVLVNFEMLSDRDKNKNVYEVSVNGFYNLLSKPLVYESFILQDEEARRDSIGNDPFNSVDAWFGGDYVNIDFKVFFLEHSSKVHMINLVYDDTRADADTIYLTLRHNAYGDVPGYDASMFYSGYGICSFKISDLLPEGTESKAVKLTWLQNYYGSEPKEVSDSGTFGLGNKGDIARKDVGFETLNGVK